MDPSADDVFASSAAERRAFADLLESLDDAQLATPSLCAGWDVRTVAGHLASATSSAVRPLLLAVVRSGFRPDRANDALAREQARRPVPDLVADLRRQAGSRYAAPLIGPRGPLTDVLVHTGDVRVPLGLPHEPAPEAAATALDFVTGGRPVGFVRRGTLAGLALDAEDLGRRWGTGERLTGRGTDLLLAACGRTAVLDRLAGPGVAVLAARLGR